MVLGHSIRRILVHRAATSKHPKKVIVSCHLDMDVPSNVGKRALLGAISVSFTGIIHNPFPPIHHQIEVTEAGDEASVDSKVSLTLGNMNSIGYLVDTNLCTSNGKYVVATSAPKYRFKKLCGMGFTLMNESLVLMTPYVKQYMVDVKCRRPNPSHL